MRRRYKSELYKNRVEKIKQMIPDACFGVDVIVRFPGETNDDFLATYNFLNELDIAYLHVFTYSERLNTDAMKIRKSVPKEIRVQRSKMLHILSDKKQRYFNNQFIDTTRLVLFENSKNGELYGYTDNYIQVRINGDIKLINSILPVKLLSNHGNMVDGNI